jgi:hypothetical protein
VPAILSKAPPRAFSGARLRVSGEGVRLVNWRSGASLDVAAVACQAGGSRGQKLVIVNVVMIVLLGATLCAVMTSITLNCLKSKVIIR